MHVTLFGLKRGYWSGWRVGRDLLRTQPVTPARFDLLYLLARAPHQWMLQSMIWKVLGVAGPTTRRMVKSLVQRGFVLRFPAPNDARERIVQLTEEGRRVIGVAVEATMTSGAFDAVAVRAVGRRERIGALDRLICAVRKGFGDRASRLYAEDLFAAWVPPLRVRALFDPMFEGDS